MKISAKKQATQAELLTYLQSLGNEIWWSAYQISQRIEADLTIQQVAAALSLLERKGLVTSQEDPRSRRRFYDLTQAGREAEVVA